MMDLVVALKCAKMVARKLADERPTGGYKVKVKGEEQVVKFGELMEALRELEHKAEAGQLVETGTCETCNCIDFGDMDEKAQCYPKGYTSWRRRTDHCSFYTPRFTRR